MKKNIFSISILLTLPGFLSQAQTSSNSTYKENSPQSLSSTQPSKLSNADTIELTNLTDQFYAEPADSLLEKVDTFFKSKLGNNYNKSALMSEYSQILAKGFFDCSDFYLKKHDSIATMLLRSAAKNKIVSAFVGMSLNSPNAYDADFENFMYEHLNEFVNAGNTNNLEILRNIATLINRLALTKNNESKTYNTTSFKKFFAKFHNGLNRNSAVRISKYFSNKYLIDLGLDSIAEMLIYFPKTTLDQNEILPYALIYNFSSSDKQVQKIVTSWMNSGQNFFQNLARVFLLHIQGKSDNAKFEAFKQLSENGDQLTSLAPYYFILVDNELTTDELKKVFDQKIIDTGVKQYAMTIASSIVSASNFWKKIATNEYKLKVVKTILNQGGQFYIDTENLQNKMYSLELLINSATLNMDVTFIRTYIKEILSTQLLNEPKTNHSAIETHFRVLSKALSKILSPMQIRELYTEVIQENSQKVNSGVIFVLTSMKIAEPEGQKEFINKIKTELTSKYYGPWNRDLIEKYISDLDNYLQ